MVDIICLLCPTNMMWLACLHEIMQGDCEVGIMGLEFLLIPNQTPKGLHLSLGGLREPLGNDFLLLIFFLLLPLLKLDIPLADNDFKMVSSS